MNKQYKKRILVIVADYPSESGVTLMYVHTRNKAYLNDGYDVVVLNFSAQTDYVYENVPVITLNTYKDEPQNYDILLLHAANLRNHYKFLKKYGHLFPRFVFFYHGHEVLNVNKVYPMPYSYQKTNYIRGFIRSIYDVIKLRVWKSYLPKVKEKSDYVFVSKWMQEMFFEYTGIKEQWLSDKCHITYNSVGADFENKEYDDKCTKEYDFITIRSFLDGSKYCIDLVNEWAKNTPNARFLVIGRGEYFSHYPKSNNITWINNTLKHSEMLSYLNKSRYALMPTRTDAQGLMMCEMAAYGIPVITSDIPVCHEVFDGFANVHFIDNAPNLSLEKFLTKDSVCIKDERYYLQNTIKRELELFGE